MIVSQDAQEPPQNINSPLELEQIVEQIQLPAQKPWYYHSSKKTTPKTLWVKGPQQIAEDKRRATHVHKMPKYPKKP
jgi:hypothetical protein